MGQIQMQDPPLRVACAKNRAVVDRSLPELMRRHMESGVGLLPDAPPLASPLLAIDFRILFSCLTDADHGDAFHASSSNSHITVQPQLPLRSAHRLEALKRYISALPPSSTLSEQTRNELRSVSFSRVSPPIEHTARRMRAPLHRQDHRSDWRICANRTEDGLRAFL